MVFSTTYFTFIVTTSKLVRTFIVMSRGRLNGSTNREVHIDISFLGLSRAKVGSREVTIGSLRVLYWGLRFSRWSTGVGNF
jgi:hypothetical protein